LRKILTENALKKYLFQFLFYLLPGFLVLIFLEAEGQTVIPNGGFETWINYGSYEEPQYWDTPNDETAPIPFFGKEVVVKSTDHNSGSYSAELVTQQIILYGNIPGFITLGNLNVDLQTLTYTLNGGVPIADMPTHLMGYYKYFPKGGDSCSIGILLTKYNAGIIDTVGYGYFSAHDTVTEWTHFSAWIDYIIQEQPDTMNVMAISSAEETTLDEGTTLYVDDLYLDYTVGVPGHDPATGISVYQDKETGRLLVFFDFDRLQPVSVMLYGMTGQIAAKLPGSVVRNDRQIISYASLRPGIYILEILHGGEKYCRKYLLNQ
jgi:hypothetical protein